MSKRDFKPLFVDIFEALNSIEEFTREVIGIASNRVPKEIRSQHVDIEWERIIRSRNIIAHEYEKIDYEIIWRIVTIYLPPLKSTIEKTLLNL